MIWIIGATQGRKVGLDLLLPVRRGLREYKETDFFVELDNELHGSSNSSMRSQLENGVFSSEAASVSLFLSACVKKKSHFFLFF